MIKVKTKKKLPNTNTNERTKPIERKHQLKVAKNQTEFIYVCVCKGCDVKLSDKLCQMTIHRYLPHIGDDDYSKQTYISG